MADVIVTITPPPVITALATPSAIAVSVTAAPAVAVTVGPVAGVHNGLAGLQGGIANEYYHLSAAQAAALGAGPHNNLTGIQGGALNDYYHLTLLKYNALGLHESLTDLLGGQALQHYHLNAAEYGVRGLHNSLTDLQGGSATERYHLTLAQHGALGAVPNHNDLGSIQGGQAGQYYHFNAADYAARILGSGTLGYLPKFTGANSLGNSPVYTDGTNVGIGIAAPTAKLHLAAGSAVASTGPLKFTSGPLLTIPEVGTIEFLDGRWYLTGSAKQRVIDRTGDVITASVDAVGNTETTLYTAALSANAAKVGRIYKIHCDGVIKNKATSDDVTFYFYRDAVLINSVAPTGGRYLVGTSWHLDYNETVRTVGATGTAAMSGEIIIGTVVTQFDALLTGINFTLNRNLIIKAKWSDDNDQTENVVTIYQGWLELKY